MDRREFVKYGLILAGAGGTCGYLVKKFGKNFSLEKISYDDISKNTKPCLWPFEYMEVHEGGEIYPCCPDGLKISDFGNLFNSNLNDTWNGKNFNNFRNRILNNDYSLCKRNMCAYTPSNYTKNFDASKQGPKNVLFCYDWECNYNCITCRDEIYTNSDEELSFLDNEIIPKIIPLVKNTEGITFSGGDPLSSRHSRKLIKEVCKNNPDTKISFCTNGYFLNEKNMKELLVKKINLVEVSINASTRETYNKIMRIDAFDRIMDNLAFVSDWKQNGKVNLFHMNFVVHSLNYQEMPDFVDLAKKYKAVAYFWTYQPWPTAEMHKHYEEVAVFEPYHKDYKKLKKLLHNPIFKSKYCDLEKNLQAIAES